MTCRFARLAFVLLRPQTLVLLLLAALCPVAGCGGGGSDVPDTDAVASDATAGSDAAGSDPAGSDATPEDDASTGVFASYCPGGCAEGELCVFADALATEVSCVDPRPQFWDDGTDPNKRLKSAGSGWWRKRVDAWDTAQARCNDGSPYTYFIRPADSGSAGEHKWLFFFKGGGGCASDESCAQRWVTENSLMTGAGQNFHPTKGEAGHGEGIYYRDDPRNPVRDWNMVHVYYCSSDFFAGEYTAAENALGVWFRGKANVKSTIDELLAGFDTTGTDLELSQLSDAEEVIIAGGSAGAGAARLYMDRIASWIKAESPGAVVHGLSDAAFQAPFDPVTFQDTVSAQSYHAPFGPGSVDDDCLEAHPDHRVVCGDAVHLVNGHGQGEYYGVVDDGHLGVPASTEGAGIDDLFVFMAQWDGKATSNSGVGGICVRPECEDDGDCDAGTFCQFGLCFNGGPCTPEYCDPDDGLCWGPDHAQGCIAEIATLNHQCGSDGDCEDDDVCQQGLCTEPVFLGCAETTECPDTYLCIKGRCQRPSPTDDCVAGMQWSATDELCIEPVGCVPGADTCSEGYECLPTQLTPQSAAFSYGVRRELKGLFETAGTGVFAPDNATHTAARSEKFYAQVEGNEQPTLRVRGTTFAEALGLWLAGSADYREFISPPITLPLPLVARDVLEIDVSGLAARTEGSGCADDGVLFLVCPQEGCSGPEDALAIASVGDTGAISTDGKALGAPSRITLMVAARPGCNVSGVAFAEGDAIDIRYQKMGADQEYDLRIGLPPTLSAAQLPGLLYVGVDGATYDKPDLAKPTGPRVQ